MRTLRDRGLEEGAPASARRTARTAAKAAGAAAQGSSALGEVGRDLNRLILTHSGALTFLGLTLGVFVTRKFLMVPVAVAACIAQEMGKERLRDVLAPRRRRS